MVGQTHGSIKLFGEYNLGCRFVQGPKIEYILYPLGPEMKFARNRIRGKIRKSSPKGGQRKNLGKGSYLDFSIIMLCCAYTIAYKSKR
jgi:hypothetical protein